MIQSANTEKKVILVTGGRGLVGSAICEFIKREQVSNTNDEDWHFVSSKDGDLRIKSDAEKLFKEIKPTHVVHLAACVGGLFKNMKNQATMFSDNIIINHNVIDICHHFKVKKLVSCLSTCIFPDKTTYPIDETMIHLGEPHSSNFGYAYAKRMLDIESRAYRDQFDDNFICVIPTNVFGPHDNFDLEESHVVPGLIHKFYIAQKNNLPSVTVAGSGKPLRQFIYSYDLAKLIVWTLRKYDRVDPIILSPPEKDEISICDIANIISEKIGFKGSIVFNINKSEGQYKKTASCKQMDTLLPEFEFTPLSEAIQHTIDWFKENQNNFRN